MKKIHLFLIILSLIILNGCQQANESGNTYITNTINITWKGSLNSAPSNPETGWAYYDITKGMSFLWDGNDWQQIAKDGQNGQDGQNSSTTYSITGYLITWKGNLSSHPSNPEAGWAYYNSADKKSYVYDGSSWQIMSQDGTSASTENELVQTVYLGETTEVINRVTYIVKTYADVYGGSEYFYTIYKYYYLNNKLKRTSITNHSAGQVDLDFKYFEYVEHTCGTSAGITITTDFYDNGKIQNYSQSIPGAGYIEKKYSETGLLLQYNEIYNTFKSYTTYYTSGNEKSYKYYLPLPEDISCFKLAYEEEYFDDIFKNKKKYINYGRQGVSKKEEYYYAPNKYQFYLEYNLNGTVKNFMYYYQSGYLEYCYIDSDYYIYSYEDGKTKTYSSSEDVYSSRIPKMSDEYLDHYIDPLRPIS